MSWRQPPLMPAPATTHENTKTRKHEEEDEPVFRGLVSSWFRAHDPPALRNLATTPKLATTEDTEDTGEKTCTRPKVTLCVPRGGELRRSVRNGRDLPRMQRLEEAARAFEI